MKSMRFKFFLWSLISLVIYSFSFIYVMAFCNLISYNDFDWLAIGLISGFMYVFLFQPFYILVKTMFRQGLVFANNKKPLENFYSFEERIM